MKMKRIITIILIISILLTMLFSTFCYASPITSELGPDNGSITVNWREDAYRVKKGGNIHIIPVFFTVNTSGLYKISLIMAGGPTTNYMVCIKERDGESYTPIKIATYGKARKSLAPLGAFNSNENRTASIYLASGSTYCVLVLGEKGERIR